MRSETFEWAGPVIGSRVDTGVSGVAYLSGLGDGVFAPPPIGPLISAEILEVAQGRVQLLCSASESQFGLLRELDPGAANLLVNAAIACVGHSLTGPRQGWATVESRTRYIRPVSPQPGALTATAEVVMSLPLRTVVRGELADGRGQVLSTVTATLHLFDFDGE
ncbi:PaaI family thioesterase [Lysinimonas soli]|uniref:PaaI family thioesterase n=1 Tax=Lysinimonas soli TaxID=1074233 RepID=A0ABW0NSY0_9MICO